MCLFFIIEADEKIHLFNYIRHKLYLTDFTLTCLEEPAHLHCCHKISMKIIQIIQSAIQQGEKETGRQTYRVLLSSAFCANVPILG